MENPIYFEPLDMEDGDRKLVYLLAHKSLDASKQSVAGFRSDPDWLAADTATSLPMASGTTSQPASG